ncbi:hypothetical protein ABL78_5150 [Leptomonas seymouri]|uniref:Uncharacterized protein n=1 Tax=Leptomonas seymouri TaxID=5684 RepID=A0A0N1PCR1_LEPSE|nr:hypothetical protein ABL78_5150 [Leptomonas seymouri]|eukprot:KPI85793.1 hypothetical protein ABL78_5150 [Leptomonas seymouri]
MSLYTQWGRVDVSTTDSEINSVASSGDQSPDEVVEELARMALAGHYCSLPKAYETNQMLRRRGLARRPLASETAAASSPSTSTAIGPSPLLSARTNTRAGNSAGPRSPSPRVALQRSELLRYMPSHSRGTAAMNGEADDANDVSRALARMYRHLTRKYGVERHKEAADATSAAVASYGGAGENDGHDEGAVKDLLKKPKQRRKPDMVARARLLTKSTAQEQRQTEKYQKVKDRAEEARKNPRRVRVPPRAVALGRRLFLAAQEKRRMVKEMQDAQQKKAREEEKRACTFHPSISPYAERFAATGGYCSLEDRLEDQAVREEELQRVRLDRVVELEKECTFQPTLSVGTEELIAHQRRRRSQMRGRSRSRSRSRSRRRRNSSDPSLPSHEPFEPCERLYRDGAERLLRQQIRLHRATAKQQKHVVGGRLRLSTGEVDDIANRFEAWAASREKRQAHMRDEVDRQSREGWRAAASSVVSKVVGGTAGVTRVLNRSPSAKSASTARPTDSPCMPRCGREEEGDGESGSAAYAAFQAPPMHANCCSSPVSHAFEYETSKLSSKAAKAVPQLFSATRTSTMPRSSAHAITQDDYVTEDSPLDSAARKEQLRIHLGALFYKYAVAPTSSTVSLAEVKNQIRCYYPEDLGVAAALSSSFDDEQQRLSKREFMAALARYIAESGPQPWCMPQQRSCHDGDSRPRRSCTLARDRCRDPACATTAARGDLFECLCAPTSFLGSTAGEERSAVAAAAAVATHPQAPIRNAHGSSADAPSWCARPAGSSSQARAVTPPNSAGKSKELSLPTEVAPVVTPSADRKPLRTHIYHRSRRTDAPSVPPALEQRAAQTSTEVKAERLRSAASTPAAGAPRTASAEATTKPKKQRSTSLSTSLEKTSAMQREHAYRGQAERRRQSMEHTKATAASRRSSHVEEVKFSFQPTLNRLSVALSDVSLEKRMLYARELQLRRQELQVMRALVLKEAGGTGGDLPVTSYSAAAITRSSGGHTAAPTSCVAGAKTGDASDDVQNVGLQKNVRTLSKRRYTPPRSSFCGDESDSGDASCAVQGQDSTSIDVSSLSSTTGQGERSRATASKGPSPAREEPSPAEKLKSGTLEEVHCPPIAALSPSDGAPDTDGNSDNVSMAAHGKDAISQVPPTPAPQTTVSHFHTTKPERAVLAFDDALMPRRAARQLQRVQRASP